LLVIAPLLHSDLQRAEYELRIYSLFGTVKMMNGKHLALSGIAARTAVVHGNVFHRGGNRV
jgi:hypothetical protein